jgi:hypothetical protein
LLSENWQECIAESIISEAKVHVRQHYLDNPISLLKDPRISLLIPFWISIFVDFGVDVKVVLSHRHPAQVAYSLESRDGIPYDSGILLWLNYTISSLKALSLVQKYAVINYDTVLSSPTKTVSYIAKRLEIPALKVDVDAVSTVDASEKNFHQCDLNLKSLSSIETLVESVVECLATFDSKKLGFIFEHWAKLHEKNDQWIELLNEHLHKLILTNGELHKLGEMHSYAQEVVRERDEKISFLEQSFLLRALRKLMYRGKH